MVEVIWTQLHETGLQVLAANSGDLATHSRAAGEVHLPDRRVLNHGVDDGGGVLRRAGQDVETSCWEAGILESLANGPVASRGEFGGLEDRRVARCEGAGRRADAEYIRSIPRVKLAFTRARALLSW